MKNYVQPGVNLTLPAPADVLAGAGVKIGSIFGVAAGNAVMGADMDLVTEGVFDLPKVAALAIDIGNLLYWDDATKLVTKTAAGNTKVGFATEAAANPSAAARVRLVPTI